MNDDLTLVAVLVDRSGSMASRRSDMEGGLNAFIEDQRKQPGFLDLAIGQFSTTFETVKTMGRLDTAYRYELIPRGGTALLDAMGNYIIDIGQQLAAKNDSERPNKVIMVVVTDGEENSSKEWRKEQVRELVEQQRSQWSWEFVFLGANMDAVANAGALGIPRSSSLTFTTSNAQDSYGMVSNYVNMVRTVGSAAFTDQDRQDAVK